MKTFGKKIIPIWFKFISTGSNFFHHSRTFFNNIIILINLRNKPYGFKPYMI